MPQEHLIDCMVNGLRHKATIDDPSITLNDVFMGALPFAAVMLVVLIVLIVFPQISLALL